MKSSTLFFKQIIPFILGLSLVFFSACEEETIEEEPNILPTVSINEATDITINSAVITGSVSSDVDVTITSRGICWGFSSNPDTSDSKREEALGIGNFSFQLDSLTPNKQYYYRAFAISEAGISYSSQRIFKTLRQNPGFVLDVEGNSYPTIQIGEQIWMGENLKVNRYNDGSVIPSFTYPSEEFSDTLAIGAILRRSEAGDDSIYGNLYNFLAVIDPRGLCPDGWHVPLNSDWSTLQNYLGDDNSLFGGTEFAGGKLKSTSILWNSPNEGATNSTGFSGLPGGFSGVVMGEVGFWWASDDYWDDGPNKWYFALYSGSAESSRQKINYKNALSIRCVMD